MDDDAVLGEEVAAYEGIVSASHLPRSPRVRSDLLCMLLFSAVVAVATDSGTKRSRGKQTGSRVLLHRNKDAARCQRVPGAKE